MILGVGIDIIEVGRVDERIRNGNGFLEKVFSPNEISFCEPKTNKQQHYAARFAAKEAFLKATGGGLTLSHDLFEIEILSSESGEPCIVLRGRMLDLSKARGWNKIHLSLSHLQAMACAVVIIEQ